MPSIVVKIETMNLIINRQMVEEAIKDYLERVGWEDYEITVTELETPISNRNVAFMKLLRQWANDPQLGSDQWWDDFDRELKKFRDNK
jgi:hypothetical protein